MPDMPPSSSQKNMFSILCQTKSIPTCNTTGIIEESEKKEVAKSGEVEEKEEGQKDSRESSSSIIYCVAVGRMDWKSMRRIKWQVTILQIHIEENNMKRRSKEQRLYGMLIFFAALDVAIQLGLEVVFFLFTFSFLSNLILVCTRSRMGD